MNNWAFHWVQIIGHNRLKLILVWGLLSGLVLAGLPFYDFKPLFQEPLLMLVALLLMGAVTAVLLESIKAALIQVILSVYILFMTFGVMGWFGFSHTPQMLLGLVVVMTLISSNLIHILTTLFREMARGLFQFDALAEAIKLNITPIFLSNLTTALGFMAAAWINPQLFQLAWFVAWGVLFSFVVTLSWLPMIVLSWLLGFRVGRSADRHGLTFVAKTLRAHPNYQKILLALALGLTVLALYNVPMDKNLWQVLGLLMLFTLLFWFFWKSFKLAVLNMVVNLSALSMAVGAYHYISTTWFNDVASLAILMVVPLGLIIDDGIHFFSRYQRAQYTLFSDSESAVIFAMSSVGRAIWITSWVIFAGLVTLLLSQHGFVVAISSITLLALIVTTFLILTVLPAGLMTLKKALH